MPKKRFKDFQQLVKLSFMYWQLAGIFTVTFVIIIISDFLFLVSKSTYHAFISIYVLILIVL